MADKYLPAFPQQVQVAADGTTWFDGMTLRDFFAAKAMQADVGDGLHENDFAWSAKRAYKMADAMLEARES
jgi:hypothetical protein